MPEKQHALSPVYRVLVPSTTLRAVPRRRLLCTLRCCGNNDNPELVDP
jgi:hypothetical protein